MNNFISLPSSLIRIARWLLYILRIEEPGTKPRKIPIDPMTLRPGNRPENCGSFDSVLDAFQHARPMPFLEPPLEAPPFAGIGFRFEYDSAAPFVFVDLDSCFDPVTGDPESWAAEVVERLNSYTELSASGLGIHILVRSSQPPHGRCRKGKIEIYSKGRWAAMTGLHIDGTPNDLMDRTAELLAFHQELFLEEGPLRATVANPQTLNLSDTELLRRARSARNGARFCQLYDQPPTRSNHSEEDFELCRILAFWTGGDATRIDRLFRGSALMRSKWLQRSDYRQRTIEKAIATTDRHFGSTDSSNVSRRVRKKEDSNG